MSRQASRLVASLCALITGTLCFVSTAGAACEEWRRFEDGLRRTSVVVIGRVVRHTDFASDGKTPQGMEFRIERVLRGIERRSVIKVRGGLHGENPGIENFPEGSRWAVVLQQSPAAGKGEFTTGECGSNLIQIKTGGDGPGILVPDLLHLVETAK